MSRDDFQVAAASVIGANHLRTYRNNQDGLGLHAGPDLLVAVVTDGCSSAPSSEVGARLGARWLAEWIPRYLGVVRTPEELLEAVRAGLVDYLEKSARMLRPEQDDLAHTLEEFFLFTYLVAVLQPERALVFGQGDGVFSINGAARVIDSGPENAPPYPAYALVREALMADPGPLMPVLHFEGATATVSSILISTDGAAELVSRADEPLSNGEKAGGLEQFETGPAILADPSALQKRLLVLARVHHRLRDDTTMVLIRRDGDGAR